MTWTWQNGDRQIERDRMKKIIWETIIEQKTDWGWRDTQSKRDRNFQRTYSERESNVSNNFTSEDR